MCSRIAVRPQNTHCSHPAVDVGVRVLPVRLTAVGGACCMWWLPCTWAPCRLQVSVLPVEAPLFDAADMGGIVPADSRQPFDVRKVG